MSSALAPIQHVIRQMIQISDQELAEFLGYTTIKTFRRQSLLFEPPEVPQDIFFVNKGLIRVFITDAEGSEHTLHFSLEGQFITDYSNFLAKHQGMYTLQALEETDVVVLPRSAIDWGYKHLTEGQKLGRLIAEYYFSYQDNRIKNMYIRAPKERYESITEIFPNIHQRVPQHMIASYLGITPIHLSRIKKQDHR